MSCAAASDAGSFCSRSRGGFCVERYGLPAHVFVAFDRAHSVWLDIRRDRYFAVEHSLARHEAAIASLVRSGLLVDLRENPDARPATPTQASVCSEEICLPAPMHTPRIRPHHVVNVTLAWIIGALTLRCRGLEGVVSRLQSRSRSSGLDDDTSLRELVSVFALLRPFFFALRGRCLLSSVVLSEFLSRYHVRSQCVFGVRARPFAAHCWLECGNRILNDSLERVRAFTPILRA